MTNKLDFLLSIVIPTRNRAFYASMAVNQILTTTTSNVQIVIQDNSDTNELFHILGGDKASPRLKYKHINRVLSFVDNFNYGIDNSDGEYICMIGDDDGINPEIINLVAWAKREKIQAIKTGLQAVYLWPNTGISDCNSSGQLDIYPISKKIMTVYPKKEVIKLLKNGCLNYLDLNLVKLYHGIVRKECLLLLKKKLGYYIGGLSPDIYSAVALSLNIEELLVIDYPFTISGICKNSGSADSATGKHTGNLTDAPHFRGHINYIWSSEIPTFYSVETIWSDSALAAVRDYAPEYINKYFSASIFSAYNIVRHKEFSKLILETNSKKHNNKTPMFFLLFIGFCKLSRLFVYKKIHSLLFNKHKNTYTGVENIIEAQHILNSKISIKELYK